MDYSQTGDLPAQKPAQFVKQPIKREAWPCCSHHVVDNSTSVLSNSVIYSNRDIFDQILWWDTQSCLEQDWEEESVGRFICSTDLEICASRTYCIFTCLNCPSGKNNFFENKLLREFAFLDNSSWGQSSLSLQKAAEAGCCILFNPPPFQFPPNQWRSYGIYCYLNLQAPAWKHLAVSTAPWPQSFSPHSECLKAVHKARMCQKAPGQWL